MIPVPSYDAAGLKDAVAAAADHPAGFFKAIQAPRSVATIAKAAMMLLADDAAKAGWARVTIPETEWPGMVERRGFTRENRFLEIWAVIFGPEPVILVTTGQQDTEAAAP